jgi:hypothetical protein
VEDRVRVDRGDDTLLSMAATTRASDEAVRALLTDGGAVLREEADVEQVRELRKRFGITTIPLGVPNS